MASLEVIALDTAVPQLRAPQSTDSYNMPRRVLMGTTTDDTVNQLQVAGSVKLFGASSIKGSYGTGAVTTNFVAGDNALVSNSTGSNNTAVGGMVLMNNTTGSANSAFGVNALGSNTTGGGNVALGYNSGVGLTTGNGNTILGSNVTGLAPGLTNNVILATGDGVVRVLFNGSYWNFTAPIKFNGYTFATLPAGVQGFRAYITDALAPAYLAPAVGGGAVIAPVFYNGTQWVTG